VQNHTLREVGTERSFDASCVRNICTKNYQNLTIGFQVTVENVGDVFLGHSIETLGYHMVKAGILYLTWS